MKHSPRAIKELDIVWRGAALRSRVAIKNLIAFWKLALIIQRGCEDLSLFSCVKSAPTSRESREGDSHNLAEKFAPLSAIPGRVSLAVGDSRENALWHTVL